MAWVQNTSEHCLRKKQTNISCGGKGREMKVIREKTVAKGDRQLEGVHV